MKLRIMPTTQMNIQNKEIRDRMEYPNMIINKNNKLMPPTSTAVFFLFFHCNKSHTKYYGKCMMNVPSYEKYELN